MTDSKAIKPFSLEGMQPDIVTLVLSTEYGASMQIPLRPLTYHRWEEVGGRVPEPKPPLTYVPGNDKPVPDRWNIDYQRELVAAHEKRMMLRLTDALTGAGVEIPGETLEDKAVVVGQWDAGRVAVLLNWLEKIATKGKVTVEALAADFRQQSLPSGNGAHPDPASSDAGTVAADAGHG